MGATTECALCLFWSIFACGRLHPPDITVGFSLSPGIPGSLKPPVRIRPRSSTVMWVMVTGKKWASVVLWSVCVCACVCVCVCVCICVCVCACICVCVCGCICVLCLCLCLYLCLCLWLHLCLCLCLFVFIRSKLLMRVDLRQVELGYLLS